MRRMTFDTESDRYKPPGTAVGSVEGNREYLRKRKIRFDCALVYDDLTAKFYEFANKEAVECVKFLKLADEIISHSGRRADLIVLEHACGEDTVAPLWDIKHHDLMEICNLESVETLANRYVPEKALLLKAEFNKQWAEASNAQNYFIAGKLAKARFDVARTHAVFIELERLGHLPAE